MLSVSEEGAEEEDAEALSRLSASKRATEAPLLSLLVRKELTPRGERGERPNIRLNGN